MKLLRPAEKWAPSGLKAACRSIDPKKSSRVPVHTVQAHMLSHIHQANDGAQQGGKKSQGERPCSTGYRGSSWLGEIMRTVGFFKSVTC